MLPASELLAISRACPRNLARELARSLCRWSKSVCQARSGEVRVPKRADSLMAACLSSLGSSYEITWIVRSLERALALGLIPALCLGLGAGAFLSIRAQRRVEE